MKYNVHRINVKSDTMQEKLEHLLNQLDGEVIAVIPHVVPFFSMMGAAAKTDYLLVVEKKIKTSN